MKWNVLCAALVVGVGVCSQSHGFELLDRMLGTGCGCAPCAAQACCEKPCGFAADPGCGCAVDPGCGCAVDPGCGCAVDPGCGCPAAGCGCHQRCRPRLLDALFCGHRHRGCAPACGCAAAVDCGCAVAAAPACGCAAAPSCCPPRCHRSLLDALFGCHRSRCGGCGCGAPACGAGCGCGEPAGGAVHIGDHGDDAPLPPAPMADPNARVGRRSTYTQTSLIR